MKSLPLIIVSVLLVVGGCSMFGFGERHIDMPVTDLQAPARVSAGSSFVVTATGALTNGCQTFRSVLTERNNNRVRVRMTAMEKTGQICTQDVRHVEADVEVSAGYAGTLVLVADAWGDTLEIEVVVE